MNKYMLCSYKSKTHSEDKSYFSDFEAAVQAYTKACSEIYYSGAGSNVSLVDLEKNEFIRQFAVSHGSDIFIR